MKYGRVALGAAISVLLLAVALHGIDWGRTISALKNTQYLFLVGSLIALFASLLVKSVRWRYLLAPLRWLPLGRLWAMIMIAYFSNQVLPSNTGDLVRNFVLGKREGMAQTSVFATIVLEKALDIGTLTLCVFLATRLYALPSWVDYFSLASLVVFGGIVLAILILAFRPAQVQGLLGSISARWRAPLAQKILRACQVFVDGVSISARSHTLLPSIVLSFGVWGVLTVSYALIGNALALKVPLQAYILVVAIVGLGSSIPALLGNLGTLELLSLGTLSIYGVNSSQGLAFVVLLRIVRIVAVVAGYIYFSREGFHLFMGQNAAGRPANKPVVAEHADLLRTSYSDPRSGRAKS